MSELDPRSNLQNELVRKALNELDVDLRLQVILSGVSLNPAHIQNTLTLMCLIHQTRLDEKKFPEEYPATEKEKLALDSIYKILYEQYRAIDPSVH